MTGVELGDGIRRRESVNVKPDFKTVTEGGIGRAKPRARSKGKTHGDQWKQLHARKGGVCRLAGLGGCDLEARYELHHLASRARGGPNEAWNLCALCPAHHGLVTREDPAALRALAERLTDEEYAGLIEWGGETVLTRLFGVLTDGAA